MPKRKLHYHVDQHDNFFVIILSSDSLEYMGMHSDHNHIKNDMVERLYFTFRGIYYEEEKNMNKGSYLME
jgi:hypothetical protein